MNILAFAGSNSSKSINKNLITWVANQISDGNELRLLDLNDYEMPIYSMDRELANGVPSLAFDFVSNIDWADLILISLAEHNGAYTAAFKNIFDWSSRIPKRSVFLDKPVFITATSDGPRGASTVLEIAKNRFPFNGAQVLDTFSLPNFSQTFKVEKGITNNTLRQELKEKLEKILSKLE